MRVKTSLIVNGLDVIEDTHSRCFAGFISLMMRQLSFECPEEAVGHCIIPAIRLAAHTLFAAMGLDSLIH